MASHGAPAVSEEHPMLGGSRDFSAAPSLPRNYGAPAQAAASSSTLGLGGVPNPVQLLKQVWGPAVAANTRVSESLDYEPTQNRLFYERMKARKEGKKKLYGYTGHTLAKFVVTLLTGIITGLFAVAMSKSVSLLTEAKLEFVQDSLLEEGSARIFISFLWFWFIGSIMVSIATAMVQYWATASAGAGVTLVMAYLNGNHVPDLLHLKTLITKFVGTVCAVSSGLPMGPEGPMVHIGACTASVITYMECKCLVSASGFLSCFGRSKRPVDIKEKLKVLDEIVSDSDHREFVSAGVSAGISAAFGAPIGGVLFSMEEACSFWSRKTAWRCFIAAVLSTFTIQLLNRSAQHGMIAFTNLRTMDNKDWLMQLPFLLINAGMSGLLGAAFNSLRMWLWKVRASKTRHMLRIAEVIGLVFLVSLVGFFFGWTAGTCLPTPPEWGEEYGFRFQCEEGTYNDVATLFLSSQHHTIIKLFSVGHDDTLDTGSWQPPFTRGALALYTTVYLIMMSIGAGLAIPGGLFMPSIVVGASWGCLWGIICRGWLPRWNIQPGLYAIMAGTGTLGGVFRSAISLVVLVVEGTRGIDYLFGVILSVVMANWVAHHIHHDGVYESELERIGNVYMLRDEAPHRLHSLTTEAIMATGVYGFRAIESVARIMEVLRTTTHNGFPVFHWDSEDDPEGGAATIPALQGDTGRLEGLVRRSQLLVLLQRRHFCDEQGHPIGREHDEKYELELETEMRTFFRRYYTHKRYQSALPPALDALHLDNNPAEFPDLAHLFVDLRPYMNRSPFTVSKDCSASRAHMAFVSLGLRHLIVVDENNHVVGIITRKDLDHAAGHGWWRMSHMAEPPKNNLLKHLSKIPSVAFFKSLMGKSNPDLGNAAAAQDAASISAQSMERGASHSSGLGGQQQGNGFHHSTSNGHGMGH